MFEMQRINGVFATIGGNETLAAVMKDPSVTIALKGHSHKPLIVSDNNTLVVNPGSTAFAIPRSKSWVPTVAIVDTATMHAEIVDLPKN